MSEERKSDGPSKRSGARWLKWLGVSVALLVPTAVGGHWWWGRSAERRLDAMIARYRAAGEPMLPSDLVAPSVADDQNAVIDLRAAAALIDTKSDAWDSYGRLDPALPLTDREIAVLKRVLEEGQGAPAKARLATEKPGVDWQMQFPSPMMQNLDPDLNQQRSLATLLAAAALYAHHEGDDTEAVRRIREMLFVSRAVGQKPTLISGFVSIGIAAMATRRVQQIASDLGIASGNPSTSPVGRSATREQVQALLAELLDARGPMEDQERAWRGERVSQLDTMQALVEGRLDATSPGARPGPNGEDRSNVLSGYLMRPLFLGDAQLMADYMAGMIAAGEAPNLPACAREAADGSVERGDAAPYEAHVCGNAASVVGPGASSALPAPGRAPLGIRRDRGALVRAGPRRGPPSAAGRSQPAVPSVGPARPARGGRDAALPARRRRPDRLQRRPQRQRRGRQRKAD